MIKNKKKLITILSKEKNEILMNKKFDEFSKVKNKEYKIDQ